MVIRDLAEQILERPDAVLQMEKIQTALADEKRRRHEFREWITENVKAEFINGQTVIHSPVKRRHWKVTDLLSRILSVYVSLKKLGAVGTEKVMIALTRNDYEPDLCFFSKEKSDLFEDEQVLFPAPDFVVEILSKKKNSRRRPRHQKDRLCLARCAGILDCRSCKTPHRTIHTPDQRHGVFSGQSAPVWRDGGKCGHSGI